MRGESGKGLQMKNSIFSSEGFLFINVLTLRCQKADNVCALVNAENAFIVISMCSLGPSQCGMSEVL